MLNLSWKPLLYLVRSWGRFIIENDVIAFFDDFDARFDQKLLHDFDALELLLWRRCQIRIFVAFGNGAIFSTHENATPEGQLRPSRKFENGESCWQLLDARHRVEGGREVWHDAGVDGAASVIGQVLAQRVFRLVGLWRIKASLWSTYKILFQQLSY